jgi:recombination protein RecR
MTTLELLENFISSLPTLGPKSARKIAIAMMLDKERLMKDFATLLNQTYEAVKKCDICGHLDEQNPCEICSNNSRSKNILCIVETINDLYKIEKTSCFNGIYHVLWGRLSASDNITPDKLNIQQLIKRVYEEKFSEIIVASSSTVAGQTTAYYVIDILENIKNTKNILFKITTLAKGIPLGSEIDYLDEGTITASFKARNEI